MASRVFYLLLSVTACAALCPSKVEETGIPEKEKEHVVDLHNFFRKQLANKSVLNKAQILNLPKIEWDENLAKEAQNFANLCIDEELGMHNRFLLRQSIYSSWSKTHVPGPQWNRAVKRWYDESKNHHGGNTQLLWARTNKVGCGYVTFPYYDGFKKIYVCNYGPTYAMQETESYSSANVDPTKPKIIYMTVPNYQGRQEDPAHLVRVLMNSPEFMELVYHIVEEVLSEMYSYNEPFDLYMNEFKRKLVEPHYINHSPISEDIPSFYNPLHFKKYEFLT